MRDIARIHHVSINAVSLALNNKSGVSETLRLDILRTAEEIGYFKARARFAKLFAQTTVCVMISRHYASDTFFYGRILFAIEEEAKSLGKGVLVHFFDDEDFSLPSPIAEQSCSGIIIVGKIEDRHIDRILRYGLPLVLIDHSSLNLRVDSIMTANRDGAYTAVRYLSRLGFSKIGFYGELSYSLPIKERFWGYREGIADFVCAAQGLPVEEYVNNYSVLEGIEHAVLKNESHTIIELMRDKVSLPEVYVCSNDKAAISLMMALSFLGYAVPRDISLVGFDNIDMACRVHPPLTTLRVHTELMGARAVQRLLYKQDPPQAPSEQTVISVDLIERESVYRA